MVEICDYVPLILRITGRAGSMQSVPEVDGTAKLGNREALDVPLVMERVLYSSTIGIAASNLQETVVGREVTKRTRMLEFGYCAELAKELNYEEIFGRVGPRLTVGRKGADTSNRERELQGRGESLLGRGGDRYDDLAVSERHNARDGDVTVAEWDCYYY